MPPMAFNPNFLGKLSVVEGLCLIVIDVKNIQFSQTGQVLVCAGHVFKEFVMTSVDRNK